MNRLLLISILILPACASVDIVDRTVPNLAFPADNRTARTFFYSNNAKVPERRMLRAIKSYCGLPNDVSDDAIPHSRRYGIHGTWFLDFACPETP